MAATTPAQNKNAPASDSPDSIPSVAETSVASSQQGGDEDDDVNEEEEVFSPRRLFMSDDDTTSSSLYPMMMMNLCHLTTTTTTTSTTGDEFNTEVAYLGSEVSTTSSDTTVIASRNLSMRESSPPSTTSKAEGDVPTVVVPSALADENNDNDDATHTRREYPKMTFKDPSEVGVSGASCSGALNLTHWQLAEIFVAFQHEGKKKWSSSWSKEEESPATNNTTTETEELDEGRSDNHDHDDDDATVHLPPQQMTLREELLLRECAALKNIIEDDSAKITNLKRAMEAQREMNALTEMEKEDKVVELNIANGRIDALKREKEVMCERQEELLETIHILKMEVDRLATLELATGDGNCDLNDDHHHFLDIQPGSSEANDRYVSSIAKLRSELEAKEQENVQLRAQAEYFKASLECRTRSRDVEGTPSVTSSAAEIAAVSVALEGISKRLEAIEKKKQDAESRFLEALEQKNAEINEIRESLHLERRDNETLKISQDPDEVEVLFPNGVKNVGEPPPMTPPRDSLCCWAN